MALPQTHRLRHLERATDTLATRTRMVGLAAGRQAREFAHAAGYSGAMAFCSLLFGTIAAQAMTDLLSSWFTRTLALAATGLGAIAAFQRSQAQHRRSLDQAAYGVSGTTSLPQRRGVVLLCGLDSGDRSSAAALLLTKLPALEYLAIVGTPETAANGAITAVRTSLLTAAGHQLPPRQIRVWDFGHCDSISDARQGTAEALDWLRSRGLDEHEIVVDHSAGRKPMHYGAIQAAEEYGVETQYLAEEWDSTRNQPLPGTKHFKLLRRVEAP